MLKFPDEKMFQLLLGVSQRDNFAECFPLSYAKYFRTATFTEHFRL